MKRKCAWCGIGMGASEPLEDGGVTHGICLGCSASLLSRAGPHKTATLEVHQLQRTGPVMLNGSALVDLLEEAAAFSHSDLSSSVRMTLAGSWHMT
jgi:hypothetical protein